MPSGYFATKMCPRKNAVQIDMNSCELSSFDNIIQ